MPRRSAVSVRALVAALCLSPLLSCNFGVAPMPGAGVSIELAEERAQTLSGLAYAFDLSIPDQTDRPVTGTVVIDLVWSDPQARPVVLDFADPVARVREVRANGAPLDWHASHDHIVIPATGLEPDTANRIEVDFVAGDEALNRADEFLYTLFVPDRAHLSLPLFDQPDLKATVAWTIDAPAGWTVVANGPARETPLDSMRGSWDFEPSKPISTYLMAFAAGEFEVVEAVRGERTWRLLHREADTERVALNREAIFDLHVSALNWLEAYTAIDYPFQKFDIVAVPSLEYGGMEHPGAVLYRHSGLFLDAEAPQAAHLARARVIAHETAHMWFGDLVTMRWFDDVWMKEVFANFMADRIVNPSFPGIDHDLRFLLAHHPSAYGADRVPGATPIRQHLGNLHEAGTLYGPILYQKAPIVMAQLERAVGQDTFRDGVREYLRRHAFSNATWSDFVDVLDGLHPDDLSTWSRVWVEEAGRPTIHITWEEGKEGRGALVLTQADDRGRDLVWPQRLTIHAQWDERTEWTDVEFAGDGARAVAWEGIHRPDVVLPNAGGLEYGLFHLEDDWTQAIAETLPSIGSDLMRGGALLLIRDALLEDRLDPENLLEQSLAALAVEENELVANELVDLIGSIFWGSLVEERRLAVAPAVEAGLWRRVEATRSKALRSTVFGAWRQVVISDSGVRQFRAFRQERGGDSDVVLSADVLTGIAAGLALRGAVDPESLLERQPARSQNLERRPPAEIEASSLASGNLGRAEYLGTPPEVGGRPRRGLGRVVRAPLGQAELSAMWSEIEELRARARRLSERVSGTLSGELRVPRGARVHPRSDSLWGVTRMVGGSDAPSRWLAR